MTRIPLLPTALVALAVAAMVALGLWQLTIRLPEKQAFLAAVAANPQRPPVAFPTAPDDRLLYRRSAGTCRPPVAIALAGAGAAGFRAIATCGGAPALAVQLGTTRDPMAHPAWAGGAVAGYLTHVPDHRSLIATIADHRSPALMIVADHPLAGLSPNPRPDLGAIPNNHLAYAGQWFFFAAVALVIYALALRRRLVAPEARR